MWDILAAADLLWHSQTGQPALTLPEPQSWLAPLDPGLEKTTETYVDGLNSLGFSPQTQGVWLQAGDELLADHNGTTPLSAASVTKVATSLAVLDQFGPDHQFITEVAATGPIENGVLRGDLVIIGGHDPLFVGEEGAVLGQRLNQLGIGAVQGNLVIVGPFVMDFETDPLAAGVALRQSLDARQWPPHLRQAAAQAKPPLPKPELVINGTVVVQPQAPSGIRPLLSHKSLPLIEIVRLMNIYSNNIIADELANLVGGGPEVARRSRELANLAPTDIQLINGSGLGVENRVSPRGACGLIQRLQAWLEPQKLTIADIFPMAGRDAGTVEYRRLPPATLVKTGTLWNVSALVGVVPTQKYGTVCFALINNSTVDYVEGFRAQQDRFVQALSQQLQPAQELPREFQGKAQYPQLGDPQRQPPVSAQQIPRP